MSKGDKKAYETMFRRDVYKRQYIYNKVKTAAQKKMFHGADYVFMADMWNPKHLSDSRHLLSLIHISYYVDHLVDREILETEVGSTDVLSHINRSTV